MNELTVREEYVAPDYFRPSAIMDPDRFSHMEKVALKLADSAFMHKGIRGESDEERHANAFMIVNITDRWGIDPIMGAQAMSFVHGKLMCEGKLIYAVIQKMLKIDLDFEHQFNDKSEATGIVVSGPRKSDGKIVSIHGTVAGWKTVDKDRKTLRQWEHPQNFMQLIYRGAREWCRAYEPGIILGVIGDDELDPSLYARDITPRDTGAGSNVLDRLRAAQTNGTKGSAGFDADRINETMKSGGGDPRPSDKEAQSASGACKEDDASAQADQSASSSDTKTEAPSSSQAEPPHEQVEWRNNVTKMLWAGVTPKSGEHGLEVFKNNQRAAAEAYPPPEPMHQLIKRNIDRVREICREVIEGKMAATGKQSAVHFLSNITGLTAADLGGEK